MKVLAYKPVLLDIEGLSVRSYANSEWRWPLDRILTASPCPVGHTTVAEDCTCGIHVTLNTAFAGAFVDATKERPLEGTFAPALSVVQVMGGLVLDDAGNGRADRIFLWGLMPPLWMQSDRRYVNVFITKLDLENNVHTETFYDFEIIRSRVVAAWRAYEKAGKL